MKKERFEDTGSREELSSRPQWARAPGRGREVGQLQAEQGHLSPKEEMVSAHDIAEACLGHRS